ncbi:MAG: FAD:protein FMN transferase [Pseudomonadota bacterium]
MRARSLSRWAAACALLLGAAAAVFAPPAEERRWRETLYVFGTLVEIEIHGARRADAASASAAISAAFDRLHRDWHAWRPGGALSRVNDAIAAGRRAEAGLELVSLLARAQALSRDSGGLFEPAIGGLIAAWGFHADVPPSGAPPSDAEIASWVEARPRMSDLVIEGDQVWSRNRAVRIDLGGFAKGAALDQAAAMLKARGIESAVLNAGGDLIVIGRRGARPWRAAIRDPFAWGAVAGVSLRPGEALFTSGNYERFLEQDGERFSHILDPRSGRPVAEIVSASVLDVDGAKADAAATALSVAGREGWLETARALGIEAALLIDADGVIHMTPAMRARAEILREGATILVADPTTPPGADMAARRRGRGRQVSDKADIGDNLSKIQ